MKRQFVTHVTFVQPSHKKAYLAWKVGIIVYSVQQAESVHKFLPPPHTLFNIVWHHESSQEGGSFQFSSSFTGAFEWCYHGIPILNPGNYYLKLMLGIYTNPYN